MGADGLVWGITPNGKVLHASLSNAPPEQWGIAKTLCWRKTRFWRFLDPPMGMTICRTCGQETGMVLRPKKPKQASIGAHIRYHKNIEQHPGCCYCQEEAREKEKKQ